MHAESSAPEALPARTEGRPDERGHGPGDIRLRPARVEDARPIEAVHYASREAVYDGRVAGWPPPGPDREGRVERWASWLADPRITAVVGELGGSIVGFCTIRPSEDADAGEKDAEMPTLYVHPDHWHRGFGRELTEAGLDRARERGFRRLTLWVLEMNHRARAFYEAFGFEDDGARKVDELETERLVAFRYRIELTDRRVAGRASVSG